MNSRGFDWGAVKHNSSMVFTSDWSNKETGEHNGAKRPFLKFDGYSEEQHWQLIISSQKEWRKIEPNKRISRIRINEPLW